MNVEQKLALDRFTVDEGQPHIILHQELLDQEARAALCVICPAGLYTRGEGGAIVFEYAGCLECGTCRVALARLPGALEWNHPRPSFGVQFRRG